MSYLFAERYCPGVTAGAECVLCRSAEQSQAALTVISTRRRPSDTAVREEEEEETVGTLELFYPRRKIRLEG